METRQSTTINALAKKLARVQGEVGKVEKTGYNSFHKYNYVTENDLVYAVRGLLAKEGIAVFSSTISQRVEVVKTEGNKDLILTTVETEHTFADGETGEWFSVRSQGQGADVGDKGGYKAMTGAMKYFLYKCFMIPTGDDPEGDDRTDQQRAEGKGQGGSGKTEPSHSAARPTNTSGKTEVPRDAEVEKIKALEKQFTGGLWERVKIHFGKHKDARLSELSQPALSAFIEKWQPEAYKGKYSDDDLALRAALNVANVEWK